MREKIKGIGCVIWGIFGLIGIVLGITDAIFYNILVFPVIGILTSIVFPQTYLKWLGKLLGINYIISVITFFIRIQGNFIGAMLTGLIYSGLYMILISIGMMIVYFLRKLINQEMETSKRTLAGLIATLLCAFLIHSSVSVLGNPIIATRATKTIETYVEQRFDHPDLVINRAKYNRKTSEYISFVQCKEEIDLHFYVAYINGHGIVRDTYEISVLRFRNTIDRLAEEYSQLIQDLMNAELPLKNNKTKVWYDLDSLELNPEVLELGMELNTNLPLAVGVFLEFEMKNEELMEIANIMHQAEQLFSKNNYHFDTYSVLVSFPNNRVRIEGVSPLDIENGVLEQLLNGELAENMPSHINFEVIPK